jgi:type I restriction enzyme, S subunit
MLGCLFGPVSLNVNEIKTVSIAKDDVSKYLLQPNDVLMIEGGDFDKLGRGTIWRGQISPCLHQNHIFRVRPDTRYLLPEFLTLLSGSSYGKRFFMLSSKQSTNLASINSTQLKSFPIPCPSIDEQRQILKVINEYDNDMHIEETHLEKLKVYKTGLMRDLLSGNVRVAQAPEVIEY